MATTIRIGDLIFDEASGEVFRSQSEVVQSIGRLAPQPAQLLSLLIASHPKITTHETIRETLWPGVGAGFQKNMHFCVRQIRAVLEDPATSSTYIETVPRRGYRLAVSTTVETLDGIDVDASDVPTQSEGNTKTDGAPTATLSIFSAPILWQAALVITLLLLLAGASASLLVKGSNQVRPTRIAVMTFEFIEDSEIAPTRNDISEAIVERLMNYGDELQVIGPTTTARFAGLEHFGEVFEELDVDYVINGRLLVDLPDRMLTEIIRRDGTHVWAHRWPRKTDSDDVAVKLTEALFETLRDAD
jgi:DNA-binding winged helix-turn-helix (wHTH) protein/TolB-like protein